MAGHSQLFATAHPAPELADSPPYYWQSHEEDFVLFESDSDASEMDVDASESAFDTSETDDDASKPPSDSPRIKCLRWDNCPGLVPPYCATAPAYFARNSHPDDIELSRTTQDHGPSPLRNIALSNVPKWSLTGALERSPSCPLAPPGPDFPNVKYDAESSTFHDSIDHVRIPAGLVGLVHRDYFDKQGPVQYEFGEDGNRQDWLRSQWARTNGGTGRTQVIRYKRSPLTSSTQLYQYRPWGGSGDGAANRHRNWFRNPHWSEPPRVLFRKSVEFEAEDISGLMDEGIRRARGFEATEKIKNRRSELQQNSRQHSLPHRKHCEYHIEPDEFMNRVRARSENQRAVDKSLEEARQAWSIAEPSLDGVLSWWSHTDPAKSLSEDLSNEYAKALKLWPSKSTDRVKEKTIEVPSTPGEKRKSTEIPDCSQTWKKSKVSSRMLDSDDLDESAHGLEIVPCPVFRELSRQSLRFSLENIADEEIVSEDAEGVVDEGSDQGIKGSG